MDLTPADIRNHEFGRAFRGFRPEEVQEFLQQVAVQYQRQRHEHEQLEARVRDLEAKVAHYRQVEEALQEAVRTARESKEEALKHAEREAALIIKEAEAKAEEIKQDAREEHDRLKQETSHIGGRRQEIVARLRAFLMSEMEMLAHFEGDDPVGYIQMLPPERRRRLQAAAEASDDDSNGAARGELPAPLSDSLADAEGETASSEQELAEEQASAAASSADDRSGPGWTVHPLFSVDGSGRQTADSRKGGDGRPG